VTLAIMRLLNGGPISECYVGFPEGQMPVNDEHELWFFINGITIGHVDTLNLKKMPRLTFIPGSIGCRRTLTC
jgi:hypothetical protein